jgi:hypothetical protein
MEAIMHTALTFSEWFDENLSEYAEGLARQGADAGFPHITYTSDCVKLYDQFEEEIYAMLNEDCDSMGYDCPEALISTFGRKDMLHDPDTRKMLLVWYACERMAREREVTR